MPGPSSATFGTIVSRGFSFTLAPGVQPSTGTIYTVPHVPTLPVVAPLVIKTEGDLTLTFPDCLLESPGMQADKGGQLWQLPIQDRRWKWRWGNVYGHFNRPEPNGTYRNEVTPQQLAANLLNVLNETGFDVSRLPNTQRPEKRWDGASAAAELDMLCSQLGCVVVLNPLTNKVELWPVGQGSSLPSGGTIGQAYTPVLPAQPKKIKVEAGETIFQATFTTEAVGLDTDGRWKKLDDLSYNTPPKGFKGAEAIKGFPGYWEDLTYVKDGRVLNVRDLAANTVYRCYRLTGILGAPPATKWVPTLLMNTFQQPGSMQDLGLTGDLAEEEISVEDGGLRRLGAVAFVRANRDREVLPPTPIRYPDGFQFDPEHGIVHFNEPLFKWNASNAFSADPAEVLYECAFYAGADGIYHRHSIETNGGSVPTPTRLIQRNEIQRRVIYRQNGSISDSLATTNSNLQVWMDGALSEYGLQNGGTVNYPKLMAIAPDGLTQQITWSGGWQRPTITTASQAQRHKRLITPPDEYRQRLASVSSQQMLEQLAFSRAIQAFAGGV